jgi:mediator of RNA polymerase II transcription subunit 16
MGGIQIHGLKDNLLRSWQELTNMAVFCGEKVVSCAWFHLGNSIAIHADRKDNYNIPWSDKFNWFKISSSVRQFGGKASEGFLVISSSGLVFANVVLADGTVVAATEVMGQFRSDFKVADVAYRKNGEFLVSATGASPKSLIKFFTIKVSVPTGNPDKVKCSLICQPFSSFYIKSPQDLDMKISYLKFVCKENPHGILIITSNNDASLIELWDLKENPLVVHKTLQSKPAPTETKMNDSTDEHMETDQDIGENTITESVWQKTSSQSFNAIVASISTPKCSLIDQTTESLIAVAFTDNTIKCFSRDGLKEISTTRITRPSGNRSVDKGVASHITDLVFSINNCALLGITTNDELLAIRLNFMCEANTSTNIQLSNLSIPPQTLLEYCLLSGNDWWDVQICLKASSIDSCFESLYSTFLKQTASYQAKVFIRLQEMKGSLYRCIPATSSSSPGQVKAGDAHATIMLYSVATFLKSLLRARDNQEKEGPAENLSTLIQTKGKDFLNVDKVLMELEHKEFFVETVILPALQNLNQWVADLTLYLLATLPWQVHKKYRFPGGSLVSDTKCLNILRELLVVIRIWGLINESCLPLFTRLNGDLDVIAHLFKMLTVRVGGIGSEVDESLLEECYRLPNQVLVNQPCLALKARGIASPAVYSTLGINSINSQSSTPLNLHYFTEPDQLKHTMKTHVIEGAVMYNLNRNIDVIRHVNLGRLNIWKHPNIRRCTRCQSVSQVNTNSCRPLSIRAWDQRFSSRCVCGGSWQ